MTLRNTDVAIVGGGLAGSLTAAMLGNAGIDAVVIDPHPVYPPDFRCEKLDGRQVAILRKTGLADAVLRAGTPDAEAWVARYGRLVEKRRGDQHGILYDTLVNTVRAQIPPSVERVVAKVSGIAISDEGQVVTLSGGEPIAARLVVLANGLNIGLRQGLGLTREIISPQHSISIGFDVRPLGRTAFPFSSLTCYGDPSAERLAYLTLFPIGATMRANLFSYRDLHDPWLKAFRDAPKDKLLPAMPGLRHLMGEFEVDGFVKVRPIDLYVTRGHRRPGVVLVGDAFATSCPAAGTGALRVLNDVERLCNAYIPHWLASPGMGEAKISAFYDDPQKRACDADSLAKAYTVRSMSIDDGWAWRTRRMMKFAGQSLRWALRQNTNAPSTEPDDELQAAPQPKTALR